MNTLKVISHIKLNERTALVSLRHVEKQIDFEVKVIHDGYPFIFDENYCASENEDFNKFIKRVLESGGVGENWEEFEDLHRALINSVYSLELFEYETVKEFLSKL